MKTGTRKTDIDLQKRATFKTLALGATVAAVTAPTMANALCSSASLVSSSTPRSTSDIKVSLTTSLGAPEHLQFGQVTITNGTNNAITLSSIDESVISVDGALYDIGERLNTGSITVKPEAEYHYWVRPVGNKKLAKNHFATADAVKSKLSVTLELRNFKRHTSQISSHRNVAVVIS